MSAQPNQNLRGAFFALIAFAIFSGHDVLIKSLGSTYSPVQTVFFTCLLGLPLVTLMLIRDTTHGNLRPAYPGWMAIRCICLIANGVAAFMAFATLPLAQTYAILFSMPLLITVLSIPILGETVRLHRWCAVMVGLVGVLIVLQPGQADLSVGHLAALISALGGAANSVIIRRVGSEERSVVLILFPMIGTLIVMAVFLPFVYVPPSIEDLGRMGMIAGMSFVAMLFLIAAYRYGEAVIIAPMQYSQMLWAIAYGYLLFAEPLTVTTAIGSGLIMASGLYILFRESKGSNSENTPVLNTRTRTGTTYSIRVSMLDKLLEKR